MNVLGLLITATTVTYADIEEVRDFDYFQLILIYPTSVCRAYDQFTGFISNRAVNDFCKAPVDATPWTIHGLWPNRNDGSFPQFCDNKKKFDVSKLVPIRQKLERNWPNLFALRSVSSLWKHEWEKHGTCAATVEAVNDEVKYFNKSLTLFEQFDIFRMLEKQKIVPSKEKSYDMMLLNRSLISAYGKNVKFHCIQDKEKKWFLSDVRLCLTKNFKLMDCKTKLWKWKSLKKSLLIYQPCPIDDIFYLPFSG
ncbi:unnamed protein product [Litomosoides sigmodontis]|uniref:Uncharacterized protein n=1 Tax=Litomosoides sigmodontis TaxID=42156 RepID=A0A3P6SN29_LITSI|nr:unnamed protein product [Litomosoides sigmodontis]